MTGASSSLRPALDRVATQLELDLSDAQAQSLIEYLALLQRWNGTYNLTSVREPGQMLTQHLADCLAVIAPLRGRLGAAHARVLDVGSGGGLPGVVIALLNPGFDVTCVDAVGKKAAFLRQVAGELRLRNLHVEHLRVEQWASAGFDLIVSRAFASLGDFTRLTRAHLDEGGAWMAMKGKTPAEELAHLPSNIEVFHVEHLVVPGLEAERCLIWMKERR
ncbi:MAG: 16S rRNA (guanine(527)-N(7))-methyltransferase RsmG [Burkholderiaceae bacterium]